MHQKRAMELLVKLNQTEKNLKYITTVATCYQLIPLFAVGFNTGGKA